jgi:pyridoxamine 5'-phosphate oxidase
MKERLQDERIDYVAGELNVSDLHADPIQQFLKWYEDFNLTKAKDPNAFTLSTVNSDGQPSARILLLKGVDQGGFEFYTNYQSDKGQEIELNPKVALNFFWPDLERQIRIEGLAEKLSVVESTAYFKSRPRGSQLGAWVSPQSNIIDSREFLEKRVEEFSAKFAEDVPKPPHWGGYRVMPSKIEFWQGRSSRLHDRFAYVPKDGGENWNIIRLAP